MDSTYDIQIEENQTTANWYFFSTTGISGILNKLVPGKLIHVLEHFQDMSSIYIYGTVSPNQ